jgi:excinuclease ABC subunit A
MDNSFDGIEVNGARAHNLKNISVQIPRGKITVVTGLSGSGKSTLAFDTIYAEGQRRYIESLSSYARNFLEQLEKPDVESITGLSPSIAIDQRSISTNPRSTVGTVTEVYDFLRLLYARVGTPHCPDHGVPVAASQPADIVSEIFKMKSNSGFYILAPVAVSEKGEFGKEFQKWSKKGFVRARVDGKWVDVSGAIKLEKHKRHDIDLVVDKLLVDEKYRIRINESVHRAIALTSGTVTVESLDGVSKVYSIHHACPICQFSFPELEPRLFSFNNPRGACPTCSGMGVIGFDETLQNKDQDDDDENEDSVQSAEKVCPDCHGQRLKRSSLAVKINGQDIVQLSHLPIEDLAVVLKNLKFDARAKLVSEKIIEQIQNRLQYMIRVGTPYLSLDRPTRTLSGGEMQRIRLATQVGSALIGILYVLDEPSIGLHPRDHRLLLEILRELRDRGNTILLVEHDEDTIRASDYVIDIGPRAGRLGGQVMARGTPDEIALNPASLTGQYLSGKKSIPFPANRRKGNGLFFEILGASGNNLKNVDLKIPLGTLCGVTGVSGSGKSTLIIETLYRILAKELNRATREPEIFKKVIGLPNIDRVVQINQKPIGRTPRSTPSTYVGLFSPIRDLYSNLPEAKIRGLKPGNFSFNIKGGRCEACEGAGMKRVEMHFLADVYVKCDVCLGARYSSETRTIRFKGKSIADVLQMTVEEAYTFFENHPIVKRKLATLMRVGLDYMTLGQSSTTLSGGEAQRIKLSKELSKKGTGKTIYILDEPTTGLHFSDIEKLIELLHELVDQGNTVLVIEHNMDVIKNCDHVIDLGPDGGKNGGHIVAVGTPEEIRKNSQSVTGKFL